MTLLARILLILVLVLGSGVAENLSLSRAGADRLKGLVRSVPGARRVAIPEVWLANPGSQSGPEGLRAGPHSSSLSEIGRGKGIVFSPDLSEPGNREFYRALGFAYFEDPDWRSVLTQIKTFNETHPGERIETLLIQSHGTNGDALKLQNGKQPGAPRSYIAPAALQENLEGSGVRVCLLAACNAGRLFRPEHYLTVRAGEGNHLFEPPTLGIVDASADFEPTRSSVTIARRAESHIEVINECLLSELSPGVRAEIIKVSDGSLNPTSRIAVPEMFIQLLLNDQELRLVAWGHETEKSRAETNDTHRERLITRFLRFVETAATKSQPTSTNSPQVD